jgi:prohibitin 2
MAMQSPPRSAGSPEGPSASVSLIIALVLGLAILLSQTVFIVPAGNVAVV